MTDMSKVNYDGLSDEQCETVRKLFDKYDLDRDCRLSCPEFRKVLVAVGLRDQDANAIYKKVDVNNDGNIDMREFVKWIHSDNPEEFDPDNRADIAKDRMEKVQRHMKRNVMTTEEALDDYVVFMNELKEKYKFATTRDVVVLEKNLQEKTTKKGTRVTEKSRDVRLKDLFNAMDLNSNGKLTMSEFVRGLKSFGHDGDQEMLAAIFHAIDLEKTKTRVWDRQYHKLKKVEDAEGGYLVPACEIFEKRDMGKWNEERATAIEEEMAKQEEDLQEAIQKKKEAQQARDSLVKRIGKLEDVINAKTSPDPEQDRADNDQLRDLNRELTATDKDIDRITAQLNEPRFHYTTTKHRDGLLDYKEFQKAMESALAEA